MKKSFGLILFILIVNTFKVSALSSVTGTFMYLDFQRLPAAVGFDGNYYPAGWVNNICPQGGMYLSQQTGSGTYDYNGTTTGTSQRSAHSAAGSTGIGGNVYNLMPDGTFALTLNTPIPSSYACPKTRTGASTGLVFDDRYYVPVATNPGDFYFTSNANAINAGTNATLYAIINNKTTLTGGVMFRVFTTNDIFTGFANLYYDAFLPANTTTSVAFIIPNATQIKGLGVTFTSIVGNVDINLISLFGITSAFSATDPGCITTASSTGVTFNNLSTGSISGYAWNFGPTAIPATTLTSSLTNPTVVFTSPGVKTITLSVVGIGAIVKTFSGIITISGPSIVGGISSTATTTCLNSAIIVSVAGTNGTIQWENSLDNITYNSIAGANASTYTTALGISMYYHAKVTNGGCQTVSGFKFITINSVPGISYTYPSPICAMVLTAQPALTGTLAGGSFTTSATGFSINSVTGILSFANTVQGNFLTKYNISIPGCGMVVSSTGFIINSIPGISYTYPSPICATVLTTQPAITGTIAGGYFSTTATGLTLNSVTGVWTFASTDQGIFWAVYNRSVPGCGLVSSAAGITINSVLGVSYNYNNSLSICATDINSIPNITVSGTPVLSYYSLTATGFKVGSITGILTFPGTVQGVFAVNYVNSVPGCALSTTTSIVTINSIPGINNFSYGGPVCATALTKSVTTITGTVTGGSFSTTATGLTLNSVTGTWTFASTDQGNFWAVYNRSVPGCGLVSSAAGITINSILGVSYNYNNNLPICVTDINAIPNITVSGTPVLSYYSLTATGFKVSSITGVLTIPGTVQGVFAANYVNSVPGCALSTTTSLVTINSMPGINNFSYGGPVCATALTKSITTITGTVAGGYFTTTATGLTLNSVTGTWTFASTDQGNFWAVYNRSVPGCGLVSSAAGITINSVLGVSYDYNNNISICATDASAIPNLTLTGTPVSSYYSLTATGFKINSVTGVLTFPYTVQGVFAAKYVNSVPGCILSTTTSIVTINSVPGINYSYPVAVCATVLTAQPAITGTIAGGYFTTTATGLTINSVTGVWTFANTDQGNFWAQYNRSIAGCGLVTSSAGITINSIPGISYDYNNNLPLCITALTAQPNLTVGGTFVRSYYALTATVLGINSVTGVLTFPYTVQGVFAAKYVISVPGCVLITTTSIVAINSIPGLNYKYISPVCSNASPRPVTTTGAFKAGGSFTTTATGLTLNSSGAWLFATSVQGVFVSQYTISVPGCGNVTSSAGLAINSVPGIIFDYNGAVCATDGSATPNITSLPPGGYFYKTSPSININSLTGVLTFASNVQNNFIIRYTLSVPGCGTVLSSTGITINAYQSPTYTYPSPVCATSGSAAPVITGSFTGGSFTTTATGITIDPSTGIWTFANTVQGDFEATYQTSIPGCGTIVTTAGITINSVPGISYSYPGPVCVTTGIATPDITGTLTGGYFSSTVSGLTIDQNSGVLTFASTIPQGIYTGQYNISILGCGLVSVSGVVRLNSIPDLPFSYPNPVCASKRFQAADISLLQGGGKFISTSQDVTVNSFNGVAFFPSTAQGTFYNKYVIIIPGCGTVTSTAGITINSIPGVSYSYSSTVCASEGQALPTITGLMPGGYFNTTATGLTIDQTTGVWTFANSVAGDFVGKYNFLIGGCGVISTAASVTIHQTLNASVTITTLKDTICDGENALFTAIGINVGSAPLYTWKINNVAFPSQSPFFSTINLKDQDNVSVVLKSNLSCLADTIDASEIIRFTVTPSKFIIPIVITGGGDVCEGDNFNYSVDPISGASFVWTIPGEGSLISGQGTNGISVLYNALPSKGSYVSVMASNQCAVSDIIKKEVIASTTCIPAFKITNLITPNSNDDNNTWHIIGIEKYPNSEIKIYTSWGDLVFETKGYNNNTNAWNGKYNGGSVSTATYYYSIDLKNGSKIKTGYITVRE